MWSWPPTRRCFVTTCASTTATRLRSIAMSTRATGRGWRTSWSGSSRRRDIDLVIDDASHMYHPARTSFEAIFPYLRPGGVYVIEDWCWSHWAGAWQDPAAPIIPGPALSNLILECVMEEGTNPDVISHVYVDPFYVAIERGPRELPQALHLDDMYLARGSRLTLL